MLQFREVSKAFATSGGGVAALEKVTLHVPEGQFCVVLGSSGAGKSSLLRAVNGLSLPTAGSVEVDGTAVNVSTLPRVRVKMSMIHQQFCLVGRLSVLTNVLVGALSQVSTVRAVLNLFPEPLRRKACSLLADVGLEEEHLSRRASDLSGGQQQRVAIARAFILDPKIVLADEPIASLDQTTGRTIMQLLRATSAARRATVLCSLHQVELAREFADRIVGMRAGRVVYDGSPEGIDSDVLSRIYTPGDSTGKTPR